jgi:uncharacterized protein
VASNQTRFHFSFQKILTGSDLSQRRIPYMRAVSDKSGPTLWLTACCHGDEVGGVIVVQEVFKRIRKQGLVCGSVHAFPLMNPHGFEVAMRRIALSDEDLNRAFPGNPNGTFAQRLAYKVFKTILDSSPDLVVDLHNDWIRSIPYTVIDAQPNDRLYDSELNRELFKKDKTTDLTSFDRVSRAYQKSRTAAEALELIVVEETLPILQTLSHSLIGHGIPAVTLELGESFVVNENHVRTGVESIWKVMSKEGVVLPESTGSRDKPMHIAEHLLYRQCHASSSGIIRFLVRAGQRVTAGQSIAKIVNAFGKQREIVKSPGQGIVLGLSDSSVAYPGAPVMAFGTENIP